MRNERAGDKWIAAAILLLAHLAFLWARPMPPIIADANSYHLLGVSLATHASYVDDLGQHVIAFMPAYSLFIAAIYKVCGVHPGAVRVAQAVLFCLGALLLRSLTQRHFGLRAARIAFWSYGLLPAFFIYPSTLNAETLVATLVIVYLWIAVAPLTFGRALAAGAACGSIALAKPEFLLWLPLVGLLALGQKLPFARVTQCTAASLLGFALIISPWVVRNEITFHKFIPFSTAGGRTLWLSAHKPMLTEFGEPAFGEAFERCGGGAPGENKVLANPFRTDDCLYHEARQMIADHPAYYARSCAARLLHTLVGSHTEYLVGYEAAFGALRAQHRYGVIAVKLALMTVQVGFVGVGLIAAAWLLRFSAWRFVAYLIVSKLAIHAAIFGVPRYSLHLAPLFALAGAVLITRLWSARASSTTAQSRLGVASSMAALSQVITLCVGLWATPRLVHGLGDAAYGVLAIIVPFTAYFAYLELGVGAAFIRAMTAAIAIRDNSRAQQLFETAHAIYLRVAAVGAVGMLALGWPYLSHAVKDAALLPMAHASIAVTALMFAGTMALSAPRAVVVAAQRIDLYVRVTLVVQPLVPILQVLLIVAGYRLVAVLLVQTVATLLTDGIALLIARRLLPQLRMRARFDGAVWRELRSFSFYKFGSQLAQQGQASSDRLLIGMMLPIAQITPYAVAASIGQRIRVVVGAVAAPFYAAATERFALEGGSGLLSLTQEFVRKVSTLLALGSGCALFAAAPFLRSWMGDAYAAQGTTVLQLLVLASSLLLQAMLCGQATDAAGAPQASMVAAVTGFAASLATTLVLVPFLGANGAAYGFCFGAAVQLALNGVALARLVGGARALAAIGLIKPAAIVGVTWGAMKLIPHGDRLPACIASLVVGSFAGLATAVIVGMIRNDDLPRRFRLRLFAEGVS